MTELKKEFDAAIIGGGAIGCSIAWRLQQAGLRIVVIERGEIGKEASWAAGGILGPMAEANRIDDFFRLATTSRAMYADFAHELREATGIDIEYRTEGTLYLALTDEDEEELEARWHWQHEAGLNIKRLDRDCVLKLEPSINEKLKWALKFPDDHQVDNRRLTRALEVAAKNSGVTFLPHTEALHLLTAGSQVHGIATTCGEVSAKTVIIAAGSWSTLIESQNSPSPSFTVEPVRGQMVAIEMPHPPMAHVIYSSRAYLVPRHSGYVITGSTTEHTGYDQRVTAGGIASILQRAIEIAPSLAKQTIIETWAGLRPKVRQKRHTNLLPVLGQDLYTKGLIYATGHYRNGILLTPITARVISELVLHGESSINIQPFSPCRFD